jgi:F0F1-type ATP synthase assembly protein I
VTDQPDDRSLLAHAAQWATGAMTIAVEMVAPVLIGGAIDRRLGTKAAFTIIGGAIGVAAGIWSLLRLVEPLRRDKHHSPDRHEHPRKPPP